MTDKIKTMIDFILSELEDGFVDEIPGFDLVEEGDWQTDHKSEYRNSIISKDGIFFEVHESNDTTASWDIAEVLPPTVRQVNPVKKIVEIIEWVPVSQEVAA